MNTVIGKKTDVFLLEELRGGSQSALLEIYDRYYDKLFFFAAKGLKDRFLIEDLLQETFAYLWEKRTSLILKHSLSTYLHTIVKYKVFQHIKSELKQQQELVRFGEQLARETELTPHQLLENKEVLEFLYYRLDELPEKCREVFLLSRIEQFSHKEIAKKLDISPRTVENHIARAMKLLKLSVRIAMILFVFE